MTRDVKGAGVPAMPGADTTKTDAVERLVDLAGLSTSEAESVVDAAVRGAEDQAFEAIVGAGPLPSASRMGAGRSPLAIDRSET
jgi:hypothetical protein